MNTLTKRARKLCKQGKVFYHVTAVGAGSFITKIQPITKPHKHYWVIGTGYVWMVNVLEDGEYLSERSLNDMNLIPNTYNGHRVFVKRKNAEKYLALVKEES